MEGSGGEWTRDDLVKLVQAAEKFPVLYTTEVYQDKPTRRARDSAWKDVATAVGRDRESCKLKYMSLRNTVKKDVRENRVDRSWWLKPHVQYLYTRIRKEKEGEEGGGDGEEVPAFVSGSSAGTTLSEAGGWGRENTLRLVTAVADFPVLWDPAFIEDRAAKEAGWDSVAKAIGHDKYQCKHKFKSLRSMVIREKKQGKDETSQWWLKSHLHYLYALDSVQPPRKMIKVEEGERSEGEDAGVLCGEPESFRLQYTRTPPRNTTSKISDHRQKLANPEERNQKHGLKRKAPPTNTANSAVLNETLRCVQKILDWAHPRAGARDDLDIFAEYIAAELRQVKDPAAVHKAKRQIVQIVEQAYDSSVLDAGGGSTKGGRQVNDPIVSNAQHCVGLTVSSFEDTSQPDAHPSLGHLSDPKYREHSKPRSSVVSRTSDTSRLNPEASQDPPLSGASGHSVLPGGSGQSVLPGGSKHSEVQCASEKLGSEDLKDVFGWHVSVSETYNTGDQAS